MGSYSIKFTLKRKTRHLFQQNYFFIVLRELLIAFIEIYFKYYIFTIIYWFYYLTKLFSCTFNLFSRRKTYQRNTYINATFPYAKAYF